MSKALRELLLRKTDDANLQLLIKSASEDYLSKMLVESLEKMATHRGKKAIRYNPAVKDFLDQAVAEKQADEPSPLEGLRDAMGHHASHYGAAMKAGDSEAAHQHAKQFTKLGHLAHKLDAAAQTVAHHEPGHDPEYRQSMLEAAKFDAPDLQAWQATSPAHFADSLKSSGVDLPGWRAHDKQTGVRKKGDGVSVPNRESFAWYSNDPHPTHRDTVGHKAKGHDRGYPFEQVKINDKHIPVSEVEHTGQYESHPFDSHPIVAHFDDSPEEHAKAAASYKNKLSSHMVSPQGHALATKAQELSAPGHGSQPGIVIHPPKAGE